MRAKAEKAKREREKREAQTNFLSFIQYLSPTYQAGWVHRELASALEWFLDEVIQKRSPRLMVFMPPRHGKSEQVSRYFSAWAFGKYPDLSIIAASYASGLADRMNRDVQRIMDRKKYGMFFSDTRLFGKNIRTVANGSYLRNSEIFEIVGHAGSYRSAGVGVGIAGMGADILDIDDPVKNFDEAHSRTIQEKIWEWYKSDAYTRLSPGGGILLTMTRWHQSDLAGRLLQQMMDGEGDNWRVIRFPAIATEDEPNRKAGEALHPERWPLEALERIQRTMGSYMWNALYQQSPVPDGGGIFKREWFKFYYPGELPEKFDSMAQSWDMAFKDKETSDNVVGQAWGSRKANYFLLDQVRDRLSFTATKTAVKKLTEKWPKTRLKLIEDKANGPAVMDALSTDISGFRAVEPSGSKIARAHAVTPFFESGNVYFPHPSVAPWVNGLIDELMTFPAATHDDQVDATTQYLNAQDESPLEIWKKYLG